jgi:peptidoglycan hydrolase CwlO-like protein
MTPPKNFNEHIIADFIHNLDATTELVQNLLRDIREGEVNFASISTELRILVNNVKELSVSIRETDEDINILNTKIALLEKSVIELEEWMKNRQAEEKSSVHLRVASTSGKWQLLTGAITGIIALIASIITIIVTSGHH